jgi:hypothetical protein
VCVTAKPQQRHDPGNRKQAKPSEEPVRRVPREYDPAKPLRLAPCERFAAKEV